MGSMTLLDFRRSLAVTMRGELLLARITVRAHGNLVSYTEDDNTHHLRYL